MTNKFKALVVTLSIAVVLFVVMGGLGVHASSSSNDGAYRQLGVYSEVLQRIQSEYVEEPNFDAVRNGALHGLLESLDANSSYLSPAEYKRFKEHNADYKANIGATISKRFGFAAVVSVIPGSPAEKSGLDDGDVNEGIAVANLFLDRGAITSLKGQRYTRQDFNADPQKAVTKLPLVVLVNRGTAGPAEIVAASILDNGRGDVLGDKTFGIGSVQKLIEVPDGSAVILSIAKYYSPSGKAIPDNSVTTNLLVADVDDVLVADTGDEEDDSTSNPPDAKKPAAPHNDEQL